MSVEYDVIVVGAGPVGLLLANLLGERSIRTLVFEREEYPRPSFRAIGINPPSLRIFHRVGVLETFLASGLKADKMVIHGTRFALGNFEAKSIPLDFPFLLSIPQSKTESLLEQNLKNFPSVTLWRGIQCSDVQNTPTGVIVNVKKVSNGEASQFRALFVCACDGERSTIRRKMNVAFLGNRYRQTFVLADYNDSTGLGNIGHLYFTKYGSVESFPLPGNKRRWIVQTSHFMKRVGKRYLEQQVLLRTKVPLDPATKISENSFGTNHFLITHFFQNRVFFCGDAAHTMSPIGGQGMNMGFADAEFVVQIIAKFLLSGASITELSQKYEFYRKIANRSAISRAANWMMIGTLRGFIISGLRNFVIFWAMHTQLIRIFVPFFLMLNIPFGSLEKVKKVDLKLR